MKTKSETQAIHEKGFTIVELLIVIVVIGILAAIVVVAYSQINQRAQTARYIAAADSWEKVLRAQYVIDGTLPTADPDPVCLGASASDFPATTNWSAGECLRFSGSVSLSSSYSQTFTNGIIRASPPKGNLPDVAFSSGGIDVRARGITTNIYVIGGGYRVIFYFYIPAGTNCGRATFMQSFGSYGACQLGVDIK